MNLSAIRSGDVVKCDVKGRVFFAVVDDMPDAEGVAVRPITRETYRAVTARQVVEHYAKRGRPREKVSG